MNPKLVSVITQLIDLASTTESNVPRYDRKELSHAIAEKMPGIMAQVRNKQSFGTGNGRTITVTIPRDEPQEDPEFPVVEPSGDPIPAGPSTSKPESHLTTGSWQGLDEDVLLALETAIRNELRPGKPDLTMEQVEEKHLNFNRKQKEKYNRLLDEALIKK